MYVENRLLEDIIIEDSAYRKKKSTKRKHNRKYGEGRENNNNQCKAPERNLSVVEKKEGISKK